MKYVYFIGMLAVASILLSGAAIAARDVEIALEAELANKIEGPMAIGVPMDAKDAGGVETDEPSNGQYIWGPGAPVTGGGGSGSAEFIINIPEKGTYAIWARVIAWDGNSDSFWVTWEPADPAENAQETNNFQFRWSVAGGATWHWDRINHWLDGGTFDREWEFDPGETKLTIRVREDATMLDCLFITSELSADAGAVGVRVPEDKDRELQIKGGGGAVDAAGKLSTKWGSIKSQY